MKYKSIILILSIFILISIASVSAGEVDDKLRMSDENPEIESTSIEKDLKTTEDNQVLSKTNDDEIQSVKDNEIIGEDIDPNTNATFEDLRNEIGGGGNITLKHKFYNYNGTGQGPEFIEISYPNSIIDGNGAVIDMKGSSTQVFHINVDNITVKNLTIKNACRETWGLAFYITSNDVRILDCNFIDNNGQLKGLIYFDNFNGAVTNCTFINNMADPYNSWGGAIFNAKGHVTVTNCYFSRNYAREGSDIYSETYPVTADTCIFKDTGTTYNVQIVPPALNVEDFVALNNSGEKLILDLKTNSGMSVDNGNISISVYDKNDSLIGEYSCLSGEGWAVNLSIGFYNAIFNAEYAGFEAINRTITVIPNIEYYINVTPVTTNNNIVNLTAKSNIPTDIIGGKLLFILPNGTEINATYASKSTWWAVHTFDDYGVYQVNASYAGLGNVTVNKGTIAVTAPEHTFWFLNYTINGNDNPVINLNNDFYFDSAYDEEFANGITINRKLTINGNGHSINVLQKARILQITAGNVVLNNITFANAIASDNGGAICMKSGTVKNCNFAGNSAKQGGAVYFSDDGNVSDCNFANNSAGNAGAVFIVNDGNVSDCNFANNSAGNAGAVFIVNDGNVSDCNFANNSASGDCGAVLIVHHGNVANCNFTGNAATIDGGAVGMDSGSIANCNFVNNSASNSSGAVYFFYDVDVTNCNFTGNKAISGSAIYFYFASGIKSISDSLFLNNRANADDEPFNVTINGNGVEITFKGLNNLLNAIYSRGDVKFSNVTYWGADGITNTDSFTPDISNGPAGQNITVKGIVNGNIINAIKGTDENGSFVLGDAGDYWIILSHKEDSYYTEVAETLFTNMKLYANVTSLTTNNKTVNITAKSNIFNEVMPGKLLFVLSNSENITANYAGNGTWWAEHTFDDYGEFKVNASYVGLDNVAVNDATINITKSDSTITLDNITLNYGESKNVTIIAQGASGITANINGTNVTVINNYTIMIADLGAGNYTLTVTTVPDGDHNPVTATSKITVNKVESTLTVDNITFDYNSEGSGDVSFTGADKVIANVINQPKAVVNVAGKRITVSGLAAGTYTLNVTTVADENHTAVRETAAITVNKVNSTLTVGDVDLDYGESKNVTVKAQGATGITAKIDDVDVGVIDFIVPVSDLAAGIHILTVTSIPDENHTAVSETAIITVNKVNSTLTVGDVDLDYGESKNVTVKAQGAIGITAKIDDVDVGVIDFVVPVSDLATGTHTLTVTSIPDENHTAVTETATITVNKADSTLTVLAISFDYGDSGSSVVEFTGATGVVAVVNDLYAVVDVNGKTITVFNLTAGTYILTVTTIPDDNHNEVTKTAAVTVLKQDVDVNISMPENVTAGEKSTVNVVLPGDASGNVVAKVDGEIADNVTVADGSASLEIPSLGGGNHTIEIVYSGDGNYKSASKTAVLTVGRDSTNITAADVTATYKISKYLVINLADSRGNPLANAIVTVELTAAKNYTSDENGQIKVKVSNLVPKTYAAKITFKGNDNYTGSNTTAEVTVKKATAKITAKAKTFSTTTKTKKYTITLKDSKGNPIKKAVVSLKVNGNTYKATTNSKGKATFKITKLSNKGTYKATVTFKANKYYKKATKNAKITVKSVWKTVAKGSKNHAIVKKIQRALKSNGYYLSYNGHYLMVDGIYHDYTKMAVKQFQKANGLKVTGKVDEKTAKKLKLI